MDDKFNDQLADGISQEKEDTISRKKVSTAPNWDYWKKIEAIRLWKAVALSKNIKPNRLNIIKAEQPARHQQYLKHLPIAISWLNVSLPIHQGHPNNGICAKDKVVLLFDFVRCAQSKGMEIAPGLSRIFGSTTQKIDADSATSPAQAIVAEEAEVEINKDLDGAPSLKAGRNARKAMDAWVKWQANKLMGSVDTMPALAHKIMRIAESCGYQSERGALSIPTIIKMLPAGITGGRSKNGQKSKK